MNKTLIVGLSILAVAALGFAFLQGSDLLAQGGPFGGGDRPGQGRFPRAARMGGTAAMTSVGNHLFVASGPIVYKIDPTGMKIVKTLKLEPPRPEGGQDDRPGRDGRKGW